MHHIIYQSTETRRLSDEELRQLLQQWRAANQRWGITGMLLYSEGQFLQIIEGEEAAVRSLFDNIARSYYHVHVDKLADGPIQQRCFSAWSMGFVPLQPEAFSRVLGYLNPQNSAELAAYAHGCDDELAALLHSFVHEQQEGLW